MMNPNILTVLNRMDDRIEELLRNTRMNFPRLIRQRSINEARLNVEMISQRNKNIKSDKVKIKMMKVMEIIDEIKGLFPEEQKYITLVNDLRDIYNEII